MREDEKRFLEENLDICKWFGGSLRIAAETRNDFNRKPTVVWKASARDDLKGLVAYFNDHPCRLKKSRDLKIWIKAVNIYYANGGTDPRLMELKKELQNVRKYEPVLEPTTIPTSEQLELWKRSFELGSTPRDYLTPRKPKKPAWEL